MDKKDLKIILDSTSGQSKIELEKNGFGFIPQQVILDDKQYRDGDNIDLKKTIELMKTSTKIQTSQPSYGEMVEDIKKFAQEYKYVIFLPMNKGISSTYEVAAKVSDEMNNVAVIPNRLFGTAMFDAAKRAIAAFKKSYKIQDAINAIHFVNDNSYCFICPKNLDALISGGRLRGGKKFILEKAGLIPLLLIKDEGIKVRGVKRSVTKLIMSAVEKMIGLIGKENIDNYHWEIHHTYDQSMIKISEQIFKTVGIKNFIKTPTASIIGIHTGIGALAINAWPKD